MFKNNLLLLLVLSCLTALVSSYGLMVAPDIDQKRRTRMHPYSDEFYGRGYGGYYDNYAYSPRRLGWDRDDPYYGGYGVYNNYYGGNRRLGWSRDNYYGNNYYDDYGYNRYYGPTSRRRFGGYGDYGGYGYGNRRLGWDRDYGYGGYGGYGSNYYYNPSSNYGYSSTWGPSKYSYNERTGTFGYNDYDTRYYGNYY